MKIISIFIAFVFWTFSSYSQASNGKDTTVTFTSDPVNISYSPSHLFSKISIATNKFESGRDGMSFSFTTKPKQKPSNIRIDSIMLKSETGKILTLRNAYRDTVYYLNDGGLSLNTIHWLDKPQLEIIQQQTITAVILTVDEIPMIISITKKSQRELSQVAPRNFSTL